MFKPVRWKTFPQDFLRIQAGFLVFGFAIAMMIRANLGTSAWAVLEVAFSNLTGLTPGTWSILVGFGVLTLALALKEKIGWGTLANILFIGLPGWGGEFGERDLWAVVAFGYTSSGRYSLKHPGRDFGIGSRSPAWAAALAAHRAARKTDR